MNEILPIANINQILPILDLNIVFPFLNYVNTDTYNIGKNNEIGVNLSKGQIICNYNGTNKLIDSSAKFIVTTINFDFMFYHKYVLVKDVNNLYRTEQNTKYDNYHIIFDRDIIRLYLDDNFIAAYYSDNDYKFLEYDFQFKHKILYVRYYQYKIEYSLTTIILEYKNDFLTFKVKSNNKKVTQIEIIYNNRKVLIKPIIHYTNVIVIGDQEIEFNLPIMYNQYYDTTITNLNNIIRYMLTKYLI